VIELNTMGPGKPIITMKGADGTLAILQISEGELEVVQMSRDGASKNFTGTALGLREILLLFIVFAGAGVATALFARKSR